LLFWLFSHVDITAHCVDALVDAVPKGIFDDAEIELRRISIVVTNKIGLENAAATKTKVKTQAKPGVKASPKPKTEPADGDKEDGSGSASAAEAEAKEGDMTAAVPPSESPDSLPLPPSKSEGGTAFVRIRKVDIPDEKDGIIVVVKLLPGQDRSPCAAEKLTKKTRVAVGTSLVFDQTIKLGPLPAWDGICVLEVLEKPTFGAHKVLLSKEFPFTDFTPGDVSEVGVDFTEIADGVSLAGSMQLVSSSS
jgi:hypothetical protein